MNGLMKDYYKILGVKEDASADEIRDRWLKLMREFHPDQAKELEGEENQQRVKEINEAYQVLKHSATRVEYDLKKTYGQGKKRFSFVRRIVPLGIIVGLAIGIALYSMRLEPPVAIVPMSPVDPLPQPGEDASTHEQAPVPSEVGVTAKPEDAFPREEVKRRPTKYLKQLGMKKAHRLPRASQRKPLGPLFRDPPPVKRATSLKLKPARRFPGMWARRQVEVKPSGRFPWSRTDLSQANERNP